MHIPLREFELHIQPHILERGLDYFERGRVHDLRPDGKGMVLANVQGTEWYEVAIQIQRNAVNYAECSCAYDKGGVCKHVTAVIFAVQEGDFKLGIEGGKKKKKAAETPKKPKAKAKESASRQMSKPQKLTAEALIERLSAEELADWLKELLALNPAVEKLFLARFQELQPTFTQPEIRGHLAEVFRLIKEAKGRALKPAMAQFETIMQGYWERVLEARDAAEPMTIFNVCSAVLLEFEGYLLDGVSRALIERQRHMAAEEMLRLAKESPTEKLKTKLNAFTRTWLKKHHDLKVNAVMVRVHAHSLPDAAALKAYVDEIRHDLSHSYRSSEVSMAYREVVEMQGGAAAGVKFRDANLRVPEFRMERIKMAMDAQDYKSAKSLIIEGFKHQPNDGADPSMWWQVLLDFYKQQGDLKGQIETASQGLLSHPDFLRHFYGILKALVPGNEWKSTRDKLVARVPDAWARIGANLLLEDGDLKTLMDYLRGRDLLLALDYQAQLLAFSAAGYAELLREILIAELKSRRESRQYSIYGEALWVIQQVEGKENADALADHLIHQYPTSQSLHYQLRHRQMRPPAPKW